MPIKGDIKLEYEKMFFDYGVHIPKRKIYMGSSFDDEEWGESGINFVTSEYLIKSLSILDDQNHEPITILYNMIGGDWYHGIAMYDFMQHCKSHITIVGFGQVRSMGTIVMQGADERILAPYARFMIHDGYEGYSGKPKDVINYAKESKYTIDVCYDIYYEALKDKFFKDWTKTRAIKQISKWCDTDTYFSAEEAVEMGFADRLLEDEDDE